MTPNDEQLELNLAWLMEYDYERWQIALASLLSYRRSDGKLIKDVKK